MDFCWSIKTSTNPAEFDGQCRQIYRQFELSVEILNQTEKDTTRLRFSVRDTGIGIAPENQNKILEAFAQADVTTSRKFGGTGLGLAICQGLLQMMDSQLEINSGEFLGSTFHLRSKFTLTALKLTYCPKKGIWRKGIDCRKQQITKSGDCPNSWFSWHSISLCFRSWGNVGCINKDSFQVLLFDQNLEGAEIEDSKNLIRKLKTEEKDNLRIILISQTGWKNSKAAQWDGIEITTQLEKPFTPDQLYEACVSNSVSQLQVSR